MFFVNNFLVNVIKKLCIIKIKNSLVDSFCLMYSIIYVDIIINNIIEKIYYLFLFGNIFIFLSFNFLKKSI